MSAIRCNDVQFVSFLEGCLRCSRPRRVPHTRRPTRPGRSPTRPGCSPLHPPQCTTPMHFPHMHHPCTTHTRSSCIHAPMHPPHPHAMPAGIPPSASLQRTDCSTSGSTRLLRPRRPPRGRPPLRRRRVAPRACRGRGAEPSRAVEGLEHLRRRVWHGHGRGSKRPPLLAPAAIVPLLPGRGRGPSFRAAAHRWKRTATKAQTLIGSCTAVPTFSSTL